MRLNHQFHQFYSPTDIKAQNKALLMKFLHKFYNKVDLPWVHLTWKCFFYKRAAPPCAQSSVGSFWWRDILIFHSYFKKLDAGTAHRGVNIMFWSDSWNFGILKKLFPQLHSYAKKPSCSKIKVHLVLKWRPWSWRRKHVSYEEHIGAHKM